MRRRLLLAMVLCAALVLSAMAFQNHRPGRPTAKARQHPPIGPAAPTPVRFDPTAPVPTSRARSRWEEAVDQLIVDDTARYVWSSWVAGETFQDESGVFGIVPFRTSYERTIDPPGDSAPHTFRARRLRGQLYLQSDDWGAWDGCWLRTTPAELGRISGLQLTGSPDLPISVIVLLSAEVTSGRAEKWFGSPYDEYAGSVNALAAIQFLGVPGPTLSAYQEELIDVQVPLTLALGVDERPHGAALHGDAVLHALEAADVDVGDRLATVLPPLSASVRIDEPGRPVTVTAPDPRDLIGVKTTRNETCSSAAPEI